MGMYRYITLHPGKYHTAGAKITRAPAFSLAHVRGVERGGGPGLLITYGQSGRAVYV